MKPEEFKVGQIIDLSNITANMLLTYSDKKLQKCNKGLALVTDIIKRNNRNGNEWVVFLPIELKQKYWFGTSSMNAEHTKLITQPNKKSLNAVKILFGERK